MSLIEMGALSFTRRARHDALSVIQCAACENTSSMHDAQNLFEFGHVLWPTLNLRDLAHPSKELGLSVLPIGKQAERE